MNTATHHQFQTVLVTGGSGFIGSAVVTRLASLGYNVIVPTRRLSQAKHLQMLPTVEIVQTKLNVAADVGHIMPRVNAVINLVGILHGRAGKKAARDLNNDPRYQAESDPYGPDFGAMHVQLPKELAQQLAEHGASGAKRFIQISAYGTHLPKQKLPSMYLRSKAAGERGVLSTLGLRSTVFRPSVVFGPGDSFLNLFAKMQKLPIVVPLARAGCKFQPVFVDDVAQAIVNSLENTATYGKTYDLLGPEIYTLSQIVQLAGHLSGSSRLVISLPDILGKLQASLLEMLPGPTLMSLDNFDSMAVDNAAPPGYVMDPELGVTPHALSVIAPTYLAPGAPRFSLERSRAGR